MKLLLMILGVITLLTPVTVAAQPNGPPTSSATA
jgi:hypothetical protein